MQVHLSLLVAAGFILFNALSSAAENLIAPSCWEAFAPRAVNAPLSGKSEEAGDTRLTLASEGKAFVYGGWRCRVEGLEGGSYYELRALADPVGVASVRESLTVLLRWKGDFGNEVAPTYVLAVRATDPPSAAIVFERRVQAPPRTRAVEVELVLQWSVNGQVSWREVRFTPARPPGPRAARVATVCFRPRGTKNGAESAARVTAYAERVAAERKPDIVLLGEVINHAGSPNSLDADAEPVPGPTTDRVAALARRYSAYFAFGVLERSGPDIYNTAVLIDRRGEMVGRYRKAQLPIEEASAGEAPGDVFPVFDTDFGKVGLLICHDTSFPEPAHELAVNGAELILVPIWGGRPALVRARAIENGVYLATSGYDYDSEIVDPTGKVLASVAHDKGSGAAMADIDFNTTFPEDWIGNWRDAVSKQRRPKGGRDAPSLPGPVKLPR